MRKFFFSLLPLIFFSACEAQSPQVKDVDVETASKLMAEDEVILLDVRTPEEYEEGHIEDARHINFYEDDFEQKVKELPKDQAYLVYCHSGNRSGKTMAKMKQMGFEKVYNLEGGITAWKQQGKEVEK